MQSHTLAVGGNNVTINYPESEADALEFRRWLASKRGKVLGLDTETTGLNIYSASHALRLVQIGDAETGWALNAEKFPGRLIREALKDHTRFVAHNVPYDLLVLDRHGMADASDLATRTFDTRIMAHLLDPRTEHEGGTGHSLKRLSEVMLGADAATAEAELMSVFRKEYKANKSTGWALIDIDHPALVRYAGLDPVLTTLLFTRLSVDIRVKELSGLCEFEHRVQACTMDMQRRGMKVDLAYLRNLDCDLYAEDGYWQGVAAEYEVDNINSTRQIVVGLTSMGEVLTERTGSGQIKVDKGVLLPLADLDADWSRLHVREPNPLAEAVVKAKRAGKWRDTYVAQMLNMTDADARIHPTINSLQARTARMSVTNPPLQQLPSGDWRIRRAVVADEGQSIIAADYAQVEMRVLASLSGDRNLIAAIRSGEDLHDSTAKRIWGPSFTKGQRKLAKAVGFGKVYGGGAVTIQRQTGADMDSIKTAIRAYDDLYPGIRRYSRRLMDATDYGSMAVTSPVGRYLPLDRDRVYAATNYIVQSTARDILAQAIVNLYDAGLGDHLLLPVHDELVAQAPIGQAEDVVNEIASVMEVHDFLGSGIDIESDAEVYGPTWGHGYGARD